MSNVEPRAKKEQKEEPEDIDVTVYTSRLYELNIQAQDAVRDFALHDIDDKEGLENKRLEMHDAFTELYDELALFNTQIMGEEFDIAYLRDRANQATDEQKERLENAIEELEAQSQRNLADIWMAKVMAWLHQAAAASGPFTDDDDPEKEKSASLHLAAVYTMLEKPFSAVAAKVDGPQKLRRVALGHQSYTLMKVGLKHDDEQLAEILGKNKSAEAEFYDEFLNELIGVESTFRQAFNPFDELLWRDILSSFIFERATDLYNEALPYFQKNKKKHKQRIDAIQSWKQNTAGLSEVYLAMTYNDIADTQMRAGNLEDASKLYNTSSDAFGRAEKCFREVLNLQTNAEQSRLDKEQKKAQAHFCSAEAAVQQFLELIVVNNKKECIQVLKEIVRDLKKAEKLSKTRELTAAIQENLKTFSFVQDLLKKSDEISGISAQIDFAKDLRKTGLIQSVNKALDEAQSQLNRNPADALDAIREGLDTLGILLSLESEDADVGELRNKTIALLNHVKYVIQFQLSSELKQGVKFVMSRILENLHAAEAASYYKVVGEDAEAEEMTDLGKLALATAYASEAQVFGSQSEQWAFRAQVERINAFRRLEDELAQLEGDDSVDSVIMAHENTIERIKQAVAAFESAANELNSVKGPEIRRNNSVDMQVTQLRGVVMKYRGDLSRLEGAKSDFMAEFNFRKGNKTKAKMYFTDANDQLREAVGNYTTAAQVFQQLGDSQAAQSVDNRAKTSDLLARSIWDSKQKISMDQEPNVKGDAELAALYMGSGGS